MPLTKTEQQVVDDIQTRASQLSSAAKAEIAKGVSWFRRFAWAACAACAVVGVVVDQLFIPHFL